MKKTVWIAREADENSDVYSATFDHDEAVSKAGYYYDHLTDSERAGITVSVEGYDIEIDPDDGRSAEKLVKDMLIEDTFPSNPDYYETTTGKTVIDAEMMEIMCEDFIADGGEEYEDLELDYSSTRYDEETKSWYMEAEDADHAYLLIGDADGNVRICCTGTK